MTPTLFLIHHGETQWDREKKFQGLLPGSLTQTGIRDVTALAGKLKPFHLDRVYSSDFQRAYDTANIIHKVCHVKGTVDIWREFRSMDLGTLNGKSGAAGSVVLTRYVKTRPNEKLPGSHDSFNSWSEVFLVGFDELLGEVLKEQLVAALVTHSSSLNLIRASFASPDGVNDHNIDVPTFTQFDVNEDCNYKATFRGTEWSLVKLEL